MREKLERLKKWLNTSEENLIMQCASYRKHKHKNYNNNLH